MLISKLNAFTLIETLVALAISSIVIGLASLVFLSFASLQKKQSTDDIKYSDLLLFMNAITYDIETSSRVTGDETEMILEFDTIPYKTYYLFHDNEVLRNVQTKSDTFNFVVQDIELLRLKEDYELITTFTGNIIQDNCEFPVKIVKDYPRSLLFCINIKNNAN
jgi:prepilin-type N-terminal cleavage/methylation domain-containing protein